jgi:hypothetical protein
VIAAFEIAAQADSMRFNEAVARTREFYDAMKATGFFRAGQDDYIYAAMLGLSDLNVAEGVSRIEGLYTKLRGEFRNKNSVQALAQILVLGGSDINAINCVLTIRDALRIRRIKLGKSYTLPALGILAMLPVENDLIACDICETQTALRAHKGFGRFSVSTQEVLLFAAAIVAGDYARNLTDGIVNTTIATGIANMMIAQQAAMISAMAATTVVITSS